MAFSQDYARSRVQFSINGGLTFPMGKFGETSNEWYSVPFSLNGDELETGYGAAKMGYIGSLKLHIPVYDDYNDNIIGVIVKFNFLYNGMTDTEKKDFRSLIENLADNSNEYYGVYAYNYKMNKYPNYLNYSFMTGFDYTHYFSDNFAVFAEASLGVNLATITKTKINNLAGGTYLYTEGYTHYYSADNTTIKYKNKVNVAYEIGAGVFLFDHVSLGAYYTGFSPFQVEATMTESGRYGDDINTDITSSKLKISVVSVQLGIHF